MSPAPDRPGRSRRARLLAIPIAVAAVLVAGTVFVITRSGSPSTAASSRPATTAPTTVAPTTVAPTTVAPTTVAPTTVRASSKTPPTTSAPASAPTSTSSPVAAAAPHIMVLMMENNSYSSVVGNPAAPYQTALARSYETATSSYGVGHYSLDNYLALLTGQFFSWSTGDCQPGPSCETSAPTLVGQLEARRLTWSAYLGSMPHNCDQQNADNGTVGHSYGVRHDPFVYVRALVRSDCSRIEPSSVMLRQLDSARAPDFVWYSPQICHDAGGDDPCATMAAGDRFLSREIPAIEDTSWYRHGGTIILTYDEGSGSGQGQGEYLTGAGNHVLTTIVSAATAHRGDYRSYLNGFGVLAGIERAYGLSCLAQACRRSNGILPLDTSSSAPASLRAASSRPPA